MSCFQSFVGAGSCEHLGACGGSCQKMRVLKHGCSWLQLCSETSYKSCVEFMVYAKKM